ncbi:hypothetical protein Agub_g6339, partial [Astrephomene gubernaculifera]
MAAGAGDYAPPTNRGWALPGHLRVTVQLSCYGDLAPLFRQANLPVLKACLAAEPLWSEVAMLDKLHYKNIHQHRGAHFMRHLKEVRRMLLRLHELRLPHQIEDLQLLLQQGGVLGPGSAAATTTGAATAAGRGSRASSKAAIAAGGGSEAGAAAGGGRASYRLPSREAGAAVLKQLLTGAALLVGLQAPLHRAAAHLAAQLGLTYFVPLATTATAMLARIKVLSLQLLLDCVKTYNALADLLPLLPQPAATAAAVDGHSTDPALLLPPELAPALQPPKAQKAPLPPVRGRRGGKPTHQEAHLPTNRPN